MTAVDLLQNSSLHLPVRYVTREHSSVPARAGVLLLHGYKQSGQDMFERIHPYLPADVQVVSPSGLFPLPEKRAEGAGYDVGYAWYFWDPETRAYFLGPEHAAEWLANFVEARFPVGLPLVVVGYSQGGFLAPLLASQIARRRPVRGVVGLSCLFLPEVMGREPLPSFPLVGIHGELDAVVPAREARAHFEKLEERGARGEFHAFPGTGHGMSKSMRELTGTLVSRWIAEDAGSASS